MAKGPYVPRLLTPEQRSEFDRYVKAWQVKLGLNDWRIERGSGTTKAMAEVKVDYPGRLAAYKTGDWGNATVDAASLESTAVHELLHILLYELLHLTEQGTADAQAMTSAEHRVVNTIEKLLMRPHED